MDDLVSAHIDDGWSIVESLRHLVFVTDAWIGLGVLGRSSYHPLGLPPDFVSNHDELGLDVTADPTPDDVLTAWTERLTMAERSLGDASTRLDERCHTPLQEFTVRGAFQVLVFETWAHHQYVMRDRRSTRDDARRSRPAGGA